MLTDTALKSLKSREKTYKIADRDGMYVEVKKNTGIGTALSWSNFETIALAVVLAFLFGYALTMAPLLRAGLPLRRALVLALAADSASITIMEIVDNAIMLIIPGAMHAGLGSLLFWVSLAFALIVAGIAAFPVNRWLIARGKGHAVVHDHHPGHGESKDR